MELTGRQIGNYVVKAKLGEGGMGAVYVCEHPLLHRRVALKVLHAEHAQNPETVDRFFNEAKAANDIRHPHIVDVLDFGWIPPTGTQPAIPYLIMEMLEGKSLAAAIPTLTLDEAVHVTRQCCSALAASHEKGIIHRDLKPENIFLVKRDNDPHFVKIVDFGIAKLLRPHEGARTRIGTVLGTPSYMSPEQCEGLGRIDQRSDIYSLGVVLFEMATKQLPFTGPNFSAVIIGHLTQPPPLPSRLDSRVPAELEAIILHALEKDPARRFQSMGEMAVALDDPAAHLAAWGRLRAEAAAPPAGQGRTLLMPETAPQPAAGQVVPAPPAAHRGGRLALVLAAAGVVVAGALLIALLVGRPARAPAGAPAAPATATEPAPATPPATVEWLSIRLDSDPPGAVVARLGEGGRVEGKTPLVLRVARGAPALEIELSREGYVAERRVIATDAAHDLVVVLRPEATPPGKPAEPPRPVNPDLKPLEF